MTDNNCNLFHETDKFKYLSNDGFYRNYEV
jgi:hypothetical protein